MKARSFAPLLVVLLSVFSFTPCPTAAQQPEVDFSELERVALAELQETGTPGAAVAVIRGDRAVFAKGFGVASRETGATVTVDMLFHIGSLTKMMTAAALVKLSEEGRIKLDAPIGNSAKGLSPRLSQVTAHQLLSQTSGLKDVPGDDGLHEETALGDFARSLKDDDLLIAKGLAFSYSNPGYALAGYLIEQVTGKPYGDAMDETLFKPLGMSRATLRPTVAMTYPLAMGHAAQGREGARVVRPLADDTRLWPAGYAFTSLNDLTRFVIALMNGGKLEGRQVLPAAFVIRLLSPYVEIPTNVFAGGKYGYGFFAHDYRGLQMFEHGGTLPGYSSEVRSLPGERVAVIVLNNKDGARLNKTFDKAFELMLPSLKSHTTPAAAEAIAPIAMSEAEAARYAGTYVNRWPIELLVRHGQLYLKQFGAEMPVMKIGANRFSVTPPGARRGQELLIVSGADGKPSYLQMALWVFRRV
jgi:CubicO group peptidase (beta-lactamase class C family)